MNYKVLGKILITLILLSTTGCGFKTIDKGLQNNFSIKEIKTSGDRRINFQIKNDLLINSTKDSEKNIKLNLETKKNKNIKEKNIKNEIVKYEIKISSIISFSLENNSTNYKSNITVSGDYLVAKSYSTTLNNEKKLIENLVNEISEKILDEIIKKINDL